MDAAFHLFSTSSYSSARAKSVFFITEFRIIYKFWLNSQRRLLMMIIPSIGWLSFSGHPKKVEVMFLWPRPERYCRPEPRHFSSFTRLTCRVFCGSTRHRFERLFIVIIAITDDIIWEASLLSGLYLETETANCKTKFSARFVSWVIFCYIYFAREQYNCSVSWSVYYYNWDAFQLLATTTKHANWRRSGGNEFKWLSIYIGWRISNLSITLLIPD